MKKELSPQYLDETFGPSIDETIDRYKRQLTAQEPVRLSNERHVLLTIYDRLLHRKTRNEHANFYSNASAKEIGAKILELTKEEVKQDGEK